jgi:hypothetical protein
MAKVTLTIAIVLSVAVTTASAATKHRRPPHANPPIYNVDVVSPLVPLVCRPTPLVGQGRMTGDELDSSIIAENEPAMSALGQKRTSAKFHFDL